MLSKEKIEKAKERISKSLNDVCFSTLYSQEENDKDEKALLEYIERLEHKIQVKDETIREQGQVIKDMCSDKQKLIEKIKRRLNFNNNRLGDFIDGDDFMEMYEYSGRVNEDKEILEIVRS